MINVEIDWSGYTDYKEYEEKMKGYHLTDEDIEKIRKKNQPPTYLIYYGINTNHVTNYGVHKEKEDSYWYEKCNYGVPSGTNVVNINFTNGRSMRLYCHDYAATKIIKMLQGEMSDNEPVKVNGVKESYIITETKVTSMPDSN